MVPKVLLGLCAKIGSVFWFFIWAIFRTGEASQASQTLPEAGIQIGTPWVPQWRNHCSAVEHPFLKREWPATVPNSELQPTLWEQLLSLSLLFRLHKSQSFLPRSIQSQPKYLLGIGVISMLFPQSAVFLQTWGCYFNKLQFFKMSYKSFWNCSSSLKYFKRA